MANDYRSTTHRPIASWDNELIAVLQPDCVLNIISCNIGQAITSVPLPSNVAQSVTDRTAISWSPDSVFYGTDIDPFHRRWILLTMSHRVIVFAIDTFNHVKKHRSMLLADYQLEHHPGKISYANFVTSHHQILIIFETATHSVILSTTKAERNEIPNPKFPTQQAFIESPSKRSAALMLRSKAQDQISVFSSTEDGIEISATFVPSTVDLQSATWAPNGDPILAFADSATYGLKVVFYTAMGHALKQLDINGSSQGPNSVTDELFTLGASKVAWVNSTQHVTLLAVGDGHGRVLIYAQDNREMKNELLTTISHESTIDGATTIVWQENEQDQHFVQQEVAFDLQFDHKTLVVDDVQFNADATQVLSRIRTFPRAIWLWRCEEALGRLMVLLIFKHDVRQAVWHPSNPNILVIATNCKSSQFFCWHDLQLPPQDMDVGLPSTSTAKWKLQWLQQHSNARAPLMISSAKCYDVILLERRGDQVHMERVLNMNDADDGEETDLFDTPSKPSQKQSSSAGYMATGLTWDEKELVTDEKW